MPFKSKSQQRFFFAAEARGELPQGTARRWAHHTKNIKKLPEHVKKAFVLGLSKVAVMDMAEEARLIALAPMQTRVPGSQLDKETAQPRFGSKRTKEPEGREVNSKLHHKVKNARQP